MECAAVPQDKHIDGASIKSAEDKFRASSAFTTVTTTVACQGRQQNSLKMKNRSHRTCTCLKDDLSSRLHSSTNTAWTNPKVLCAGDTQNCKQQYIYASSVLRLWMRWIASTLRLRIALLRGNARYPISQRIGVEVKPALALTLLLQRIVLLPLLLQLDGVSQPFSSTLWRLLNIW